MPPRFLGRTNVNNLFDATPGLAASESRGYAVAGQKLCGVANHFAVRLPLCETVSSRQNAQGTEGFEPSGRRVGLLPGAAQEDAQGAIGAIR